MALSLTRPPFSISGLSIKTLRALLFLAEIGMAEQLCTLGEWGVPLKNRLVNRVVAASLAATKKRRSVGRSR